jgi:RNA polymerase sigma-70 factor, ECF subfamily
MSLEAFKSRVLPAKDKMYRFATRLLKDEEEAKDIVQEAMIRVWNKRDDMHTLKNMEAWCMRIVRNLALDRLKSKQFNNNRLDETYHLQASGVSPEQRTEIDNTMENIHHFIAGLPDKQRQIIQLRDIEGFSYKEIGDILNLDANNVKVNLFRARKSVRENLLNINAYGLEEN